jgi:malonate transporter and related proteins
VSLGLFLAEKRPAGNGRNTSFVFTTIKLIVQPAFTWWMAAHVFALPADTVDIAVLLAALPTGTGPYMLAEFYQREAHVTSQTILFSTVASLVTLSMLLLIMQRHGF